MVEQMKRVRKVDGYIEIQATPSFVYDIPIAQLVEDHLNGRMNWLSHLRAKNWFTKEIEKEFISLLSANGIAVRDLSKALRLVRDIPTRTPDPDGAA
jgi:hypothetical protein